MAEDERTGLTILKCKFFEFSPVRNLLPGARRVADHCNAKEGNHGM